MTIAKRLIILLAVPLMALLFLGIFTRLQLAEIEQRTEFAAVTQVGSLAALGNVSRSFTEMRVNVRRHLLSTHQTQRAAGQAAVAAIEGMIVLEQLAQLRVLLVDGKAAAREILAAPLSTVASHVVTVVSGPEAIAAVKAQDPAAGDCLETNRDVFRALFPREAFAAFEQQVGGFALADALAGLQPAATEKGLLSP